MTELTITQTTPDLHECPPLIYDWQIYPMMLIDKKLSGDRLTLTISVRRGPLEGIVTIEHYYPVRELIDSANLLESDLYRAQEFIYNEYLRNSPIMTCAEPPKLDYALCHCGAGCDFDWRDNEPCWGEVTPVDVPGGDDDWQHACRGHADCYGGGEYRAFSPGASE